MFFAAQLLADTFDTFKHFPIENPLSYKSVRTIAQDESGYMWFGSQEGLHRYDGYEIKSYLHNIEQPDSLSSDVISRIMIDSRQRLWIATWGGGLNLMNTARNGFHHFTTSTEPYALTDDNVNALLEDDKGNIWIGTEQGLNLLSQVNDKWQVLHIKASEENGLSHDTVHSLMQTQTGEIWVGTNGGGISVFNADGNFLRTINFNALSSDNELALLINNLFEDGSGNIWIGTIENGLIKYDTQTTKFTHFQYEEGDSTSLPSNTIEWIHQDSSKRLWIATDKGLVVKLPAKPFMRINHTVTNPYSLTNDFVLTVFEDANKMVWVGTFSGVSRWDPHIATFKKYDNQRHAQITSSLITSFTELENGNVLVSAYDGEIYIVNKLNQQVTTLKVDDKLANVRFSSLYANDNILWIGTRSSGLYQYDIQTKTLKHHLHDPNNPLSISANSITDTYRDSWGNIWVSTYHNGLNKLNEDGTFTRYLPDENTPEKGPSTKHLLQITEDESGNLWLATYGGGINKFNPATGQFTHIRHDPSNTSGLSSDIAWIMHFDKAGNLWVGTQAAGLNILTTAERLKNNFVFEHLTISDGLKDQTVYGITQDDEGNIWFSANNGISRYLPEQRSFKHFDNRHGLTDLEFNHGAVFKGSDNTLYFGSAKGFTSINPEQTLSDQPAPIVRLNAIYKQNEALQFESDISKVRQVEFGHQDPLISFEYVGLNYSDPDATKYKYRLLGFDDEWIDAGKLRRATYTNLPAGKYTLQIIAANSDNVWSEPGYSLSVVVNPAPWQTWWAYLLYVFALALMLLSYSRFLNRKLVVEQQQRLLLKEQVVEKTQKYVQKNLELEQANQELEKSAIIDKVTGVKSRRYLDIYIEQTSQLMNQIHHNLLPVQRSLLPRLYVLMVQIDNMETVNDGQLVNLTDLMLYSRNIDDLVVRWSDDAFAIIGYEKDNNAAELAARLSQRVEGIFSEGVDVKIAFSNYPFDIEQPLSLGWDQISVLIELGLSVIRTEQGIDWIGLMAPKPERFDYIEVMKAKTLSELKEHIVVKHS
ncbi:two-component regulator propeller domain-containing protein [Thalassotalea euphylliae]|uniref:ligand-binding sensor domain-containing protein n=1 Tax=Thalassotalea euphylliae TaxID=1655234 RepID=UPI003629ECEB